MKRGKFEIAGGKEKEDGASSRAGYQIGITLVILVLWDSPEREIFTGMKSADDRTGV